MKSVRQGLALVACAAIVLCALPALAAADGASDAKACRELPSFAALTAALKQAVVKNSACPDCSGASNGGLDFNMWATVVDRDGRVCQVTRTGAAPGDQWPGSRVISTQKANAANAFSLPQFALSTANLYEPTQPGHTLWELTQSNPVEPIEAYFGNGDRYGTADDPMRGHRIGGVNVFGGGLPLYDAAGHLVGALGVSGDTSCSDHVIAWKVRDALGLDRVPGGVAPGAPGGTDNLIPAGNPLAGGYNDKVPFGHPECSAASTAIILALPTDFPVGAATVKKP